MVLQLAEDAAIEGEGSAEEEDPTITHEVETEEGQAEQPLPNLARSSNSQSSQLNEWYRYEEQELVASERQTIAVERQQI